MVMYATIVAKTKPDFPRLLSLAQESTGRNIASRSDGYELTDERKYANYLSELNSSVRLDFDEFTHVTVFVLLEVSDMWEFLSAAQMPFVLTETKKPHIYGAVVCGPMTGWRRAMTFVRSDIEQYLRTLFKSDNLNIEA